MSCFANNFKPRQLDKISTEGTDFGVSYFLNKVLGSFLDEFRFRLIYVAEIVGSTCRELSTQQMILHFYRAFSLLR
jgi:hypothetical protein